jgi:hypothetical protein
MLFELFASAKAFLGPASEVDFGGQIGDYAHVFLHCRSD